MTTTLLDGKVRVDLVSVDDGIADLSAPTVAEIGAGTEITRKLTPDGLNITPTDGKVDNSDLGSEFTTMQIARTAFDASFKFHHEVAEDDEIWDMLTKHSRWFAVVRRGYPRALAYAAGQKVRVYPIEVGEDADPTSAAEQIWDYVLPVVVSDDPTTRAVVAA